MKRYLTILMVVWLTLMMSVCSLAAPFDRYAVNDDKQTLTLYGTIEGAKKGDPITIELLNVDKSIDSNAEYTGDKILSDFVLFTQVPANADGGYVQVVGMKGRSVGEYKLRINGKDAANIFYAPVTLKEDMIYEVEDACGWDEEEAVEYLVELIEEENSSLNLKMLFASTSEYCDKVDSEILAQVIYNLVNKDDSCLSTPTSFTATMLDAVSLAALNEGLGDVIEAKDFYGLDADYVDLYSKELSSDAKKTFVADTYKGKKITTAEGVEELFNDAVLVAFVDSFDSWADAQTLIDTFGSDIGVDMKAYNKLSTTKKGDLYKAVINMNEKDIADLVKEINKEIDEIASEKSSGGSSGGGGGGGGGFSGGTVTTNPIVSGKADGFQDMAGCEWAETAVNALYEKGIVNGVGDKLFAPVRNITREEMLTMLLNAYGVNVAGASTSAFVDVPADAWYAPYVAKGYELGITEGVSDTMFGSGRQITREEAAAMALRISKAFGKTLNADGTKFTDDADISDWAKTAVYALKGAGVINGIGDGSFAPKANCTRAQAAVIIYALINR